MSHQAIYRKFRPKIFDDVLGQEHVTKTLKNQILTDNVAHAYIFSGIRGTGKTSTAKIFARAVNCENNHDGNPCNECESCKSILDETNMDVIEMDAASNNGVEDIRELRDKVKFLPVKSKYKVYIIDEVHMLSKGAFNALLKTLEEPPKYLLFILATTEVHKIPATILSRCQRFDLKRIPSFVIVESMKQICDEIGIEYEEKALKLIAANSEGALRDAQSILDRCISFNESKIDYETVINLLGTVNYEITVQMVNSIIKKDIQKAMSILDEILNSGKELIFFLDELILYFRNMLIVKTTNSTQNLLRLSEDEEEKLKLCANDISISEIVYCIEELSMAQAQCKKSLNPRVLIETKIIKMLGTQDVNIDSLIQRVNKLEEMLKNPSLINYVDVSNDSGNLANTNSKNNTTKNKKTDNNFHIKKDQSNISEKLNLSKDETSESSTHIQSSGNKSDSEIHSMIINNWMDILRKIRNENAGLQAIIREAKISDVKNKKVIFEFDSKFTFHISAANQPKNKQKLKEVLYNYLKEECEVEFNIKNNENNKKNVESTHHIEDIFEDLKSKFGEDMVEFKQED